MFNSPSPMSVSTRFEFNFSASNRMVLELHSTRQIDSIPDLNALLREVYGNLLNFDSLSHPLASTRVDYQKNRQDANIRIVRRPQPSSIYQLRNGDIVQLKVEQDTLRIRMLTQRSLNIGRVTNWTDPYHITFVVNNLTDLQSIMQTDLNALITMLKADLPHRNDPGPMPTGVLRYYALYDVPTMRLIAPKRDYLLKKTHTRKERVPSFYAQVGVQYIRGSWATSAGAGINLKQRVTGNQELNFALIYEPLFFFSRNDKGALRTDVNGFVTLRYNYSSHLETATRKIDFTQNISLGYLVQRNGEWFRKNTFKFTLPGIQKESLMLEPEFVFDGLFRRFSPSVKLNYFFR